MSRLPNPGSDNNTWGSILNNFLLVSHNLDGTLAAGSVGNTQLDSPTQNKLTTAFTAPIAPIFSVSGILTVTSSVSRFYNDTGRDLTIHASRASVGTAPQGSSIIVDVLINGVSIFTTQANRPTILASTNTAAGGIPDTSTWRSGDYITVNIVQIGSTESGADLTVQILAY